MKKLNFFRFTKSVQAILLAVLIVPFWSSCKDDPAPDPKSSETKMKDLKVIDIDDVEFIPTEQSDKKTWKFTVAFDYNEAKLAKAKITFTLLSDKAVASPASGAEVDLTKPVNVKVTAEDGTEFTYVIEKVVGPIPEKSNQNAILSFSVNMGGKDYDGVIDDNNDLITVELPETVWDLRNQAVATFTISERATSVPSSGDPLDLTDEAEIVVTAENESTRAWKVKCVMKSSGFTNAIVGVFKTFVELGYPGEVANTGLPSIEYGDLAMYHAYCGDNIVLLSQSYIRADASSQHCVKVVDKTTLNPAGSLNLGSISVANIKMITSDYKGRCVAAVVSGNETEFFYWTTTTGAPVSVGKIALNLAPTGDYPAHNFQVAGDITGNAWITALAPRSAKGEHYRMKVTGGKLASSHSMVETGYPSNTFAQFQMISPLDDSDAPSFVVGTTDEPHIVGRPTSTRCYIISNTGQTIETIPHYWNGELQEWWVNTGYAVERTGGRSPFVTALPINGKTYVTVTTGTLWWSAAAVLSSDLQSLAHDNLNIAVELNIGRGWSFGEWVDWYYDDDKKEAYMALWCGRNGLRTYKMTCD